MAQQKSFHSTSTTAVSISGAIRRTFGVAIPATAALSAVLAVIFAIAIDGCSGNNDSKTNTGVSKTGPSTSAGPSLTARNASRQKKSKHVTARKRPVEWRSPAASTASTVATATYTDGVSGVSFRYPQQYMLVTPEKAALNSAVLSRVPMDFVRPGGMKVATFVAVDPRFTPLLEVNVHKGLTAQQCDQFADPSPAEVAKNLPLDPIDNSLPLQLKIDDLDFMSVDNGTEQTDTRYYHHFENGSCYEFVLAVVEKPGNITVADHRERFDELERIMTSVKIKPEEGPAVTARVSGATNGSRPQ